MKRNKFFAAMLATIVACTLPLFASELEDTQKKLSDTKESIENKKEEITKKDEEQNKVMNELQALDDKVIAAEKKVEDLKIKIKVKETEIEDISKKLEKAEMNKDEQLEATKERMVQMYKNQNVGYIQVIFSSDNFWDALSRANYINKISERDNSLLEGYQTDIDNIVAFKLDIERKAKDLQLIEADVAEQTKEVEKRKAEKQALIDKIAQEKTVLEGEVTELEKIETDLQKEITTIIQEAMTSSGLQGDFVGGYFRWPLNGYYALSSDYEGRINPVTGKEEHHQGLDIPAPFGTDVHAAADGVVIKSGWVNGYGNTIMISHGGDLVTLYGHNSSLVAKEGQTVKQGDVIAKVGSTGMSTGNHCHFEVRLNGSHTDPHPFLEKPGSSTSNSSSPKPSPAPTPTPVEKEEVPEEDGE